MITPNQKTYISPHHPVKDDTLGRKMICESILHPVRDASLTGCRVLCGELYSTERYIPNGMYYF